MKNEVALYIGADPLTFNDTKLIQKSIDVFGFVYILLDRKNRDAEYSRYSLNYADRADIIRHDLGILNITDFKILPIDTTVQHIINENDINVMVLNLDYLLNSNFRMMHVLQEVCPNLNIICMKADDFIEKHFIRTLIDSDSSMQLYKKYCSAYAFYKLKIKCTRKLGLTGNFGGNLEVASNQLKSLGYFVIDVDEYMKQLFKDEQFTTALAKEFHAKGIACSHLIGMQGKKFKVVDLYNIVKESLEVEETHNVFEKLIYQYINEQIAKTLVGTYDDTVVIKFTMIYEFAMEKMFDRIICIKTDEIVQRNNLKFLGYDDSFINDVLQLQLTTDEKSDYADYTIDGNTTVKELEKSIIIFANKYKKLCKVE